MNWTIRRAEHRDADGLAACMDAAYESYAARIPDMPAVSEGCAEEIAKFQVWVAEAAGDIVGGLVLVPEEGFMLLANVAVHPEHRGTGLGRAFMTLTDEEASAQGFPELRLSTHAEMPENVRLYTHLGWETVGRQGNKISMRKSL